MHKKVREKEDKVRQRKLVDMFSSSNKADLLRKSNDSNINSHVLDGNVQDLEDFPNKSRSSSSGPIPIVRCYEVSNEHEAMKTAEQVDTLQQQLNHREILHQHSQSAQENAICTEDIDKHVDYHGWLQSKKRKWKDNLDRKKRQRYISTC